MKLDYDCVRDILLYVEDNADIEHDAVLKNVLGNCFHRVNSTIIIIIFPTCSPPH